MPFEWQALRFVLARQSYVNPWKPEA